MINDQWLPFPLETLQSWLLINPDFQYQIPKPGKLLFPDVSILPIGIGVDGYLKVLSAILSEQTIICSSIWWCGLD